METVVIYATLCLFVSGEPMKNCDAVNLEIGFDQRNVTFSNVCEMGKTMIVLSRNLLLPTGQEWRVKEAKCLPGGDEV